MIKKCDCDSKVQDKLHGKGKRVYNYGPKSHAGRSGYRCTVCTKTVSA